MKKFLSTTIIVLTTCGLFAQDVKLGIRGGMNLPNIMAGGKNTPVSEGYKSRSAPGWGLFTELQINSAFSMRLGVEYSGMGGKKNGMQAMPAQRLFTEMGNSLGMLAGEAQIAALMQFAAMMPQFYYANLENTVKFDYVMIPLLAQLGTNIGASPWRVYVNAGPCVSFLLAGTQIGKGSSKLYIDESGTATLWDIVPSDQKLIITSMFPGMNIAETMGGEISFGETKVTSEMKSTNFGVAGNVGICYQRNRHNFFLEAGGNYGFITVQKDDVNGSNRLGAASVMLGYAFSLF